MSGEDFQALSWLLLAVSLCFVAAGLMHIVVDGAEHRRYKRALKRIERERDPS